MRGTKNYRSFSRRRGKFSTNFQNNGLFPSQKNCMFLFLVLSDKMFLFAPFDDRRVLFYLKVFTKERKRLLNYAYAAKKLPNLVIICTLLNTHFTVIQVHYLLCQSLCTVETYKYTYRHNYLEPLFPRVQSLDLYKQNQLFIAIK